MTRYAFSSQSIQALRRQLSFFRYLCSLRACDSSDYFPYQTHHVHMHSSLVASQSMSSTTSWLLFYGLDDDHSNPHGLQYWVIWLVVFDSNNGANLNCSKTGRADVCRFAVLWVPPKDCQDCQLNSHYPPLDSCKFQTSSGIVPSRNLRTLNRYLESFKVPIEVTQAWSSPPFWI